MCIQDLVFDVHSFRQGLVFERDSNLELQLYGFDVHLGDRIKLHRNKSDQQ